MGIGLKNVEPSGSGNELQRCRHLFQVLHTMNTVNPATAVRIPWTQVNPVFCCAISNIIIIEIMDDSFYLAVKYIRKATGFHMGKVA